MVCAIVGGRNVASEGGCRWKGVVGAGGEGGGGERGGRGGGEGGGGGGGGRGGDTYQRTTTTSWTQSPLNTPSAVVLSSTYSRFQSASGARIRTQLSPILTSYPAASEDFSFSTSHRGISRAFNITNKDKTSKPFNS